MAKVSIETILAGDRVAARTRSVKKYRQAYWRTCPTGKRLVELLQTKPCCLNDLAREAYTVPSHASELIKAMREEGEPVFIVAWERGLRGPMVAFYKWAPERKADAKKPKPLTAAQKCRRYRDALREKYQDDYAAIRKVQRQKIPGRVVVLDGLVYEQ